MHISRKSTWCIKVILVWLFLKVRKEVFARTVCKFTKQCQPSGTNALLLNSLTSISFRVCLFILKLNEKCIKFKGYKFFHTWMSKILVKIFLILVKINLRNNFINWYFLIKILKINKNFKKYMHMNIRMNLNSSQVQSCSQDRIQA